MLGAGASRATAYVAMTRGRVANHVYLYDTIAGEGDHEHAEPELGVHLARRGTSTEAATLLRTVLGRDDRARTVLATAADTDRAVLPEPLRDLLDSHDRTVAACRTAYRHHHTRQGIEREVAAELPAVRAAVAMLEVAGGGRSGASMYSTTDAVLTGLPDESSRRVVRAVTQEVHAVQVLTLHSDAAEQKPAVLAAITAAAREHQSQRLSNRHDQQRRPGVLALPATQAAADQATEQQYADTIRRPAAAVQHFDDGTWTLPFGSLIIVDDADHLDPTLLHSLVDWAAVRTNTKLLLITTESPNRGADRTRGNGVAVLRESLPWARHLGTPTPNMERDTVIDRARSHLAAAGTHLDGPATQEVAHLLARHTDQARTFREEITTRERFRADMARSRDRDQSRGRDDGLEL